MSKYQRNKGRRSEQQAAELWRKIGFPFCRRNISQYQERSGRDLVNTEPYLVQIKVGANPSIWKALREAQAEAKKDEIPLAMVKRDRGEWVVVMGWRSFTRVMNPR
jgi:hypothetical protein